MELYNKLFWRGTIELIKFWFFTLIAWLVLTAIGAGTLLELLSIVAVLVTIVVGALIAVSFAWTMGRTIWWLILWLVLSPLPFINPEGYQDSLRALRERLSDIWS